MKKQVNIRASALTIKQLTELSKSTGMNKSEVLSIAIDRLYNEQKQEMNQ